MTPAEDLARPLIREEIETARANVMGTALRTPLIPYLGESGATTPILLKAENLQPFGSFKIRCALNAIRARTPEEIRNGVATGSAGNFGQGLAFAARGLSLPCRVHAPKTAARAKIAALKTLGAEVIEHSFDRWWEILTTRKTGDGDGAFIHPVAERAVMAGNGVIGLEIIEDAPDADLICIPFGGGGLSSGVAMAAKLMRPDVKIIAVETEAATPLQAAFAAGAPVTVEKSEKTFVDGAGSTRVLDDMWPILKREIDDVIVVSTAETAAAVYALATRHRMIVEGAGAAALAAAEKVARPGAKTVALLSGGNLDNAVLAQILESGGRWTASAGFPPSRE